MKAAYGTFIADPITISSIHIYASGNSDTVIQTESIKLSKEAPLKNPGTRTLAVLQPGYMPWLGFFEQMAQSDVFVLYDDVQYDKHGWRNRNRIKSHNGPQWLSVPVHVSLGQSILDVSVDNKTNWARKHISSISQLYKQAAYVKEYLPVLEDLLKKPWERIVDLDIAIILQMMKWLGIETQIFRSSELNVGGDRNERLINLCLHFQANRYYSGNAARVYLDEPLFQRHGIDAAFQEYSHPTYPQLHGDFVPYLSALDLLLNCGPDSLDILTNGQP